MKKLANLLLVLLLVGVGYLAWQRYFPNAERVVRQRLTLLAGRLSFQGGDSFLNAATYGSRVGDFFASDVSITLQGLPSEVTNLNGRDEVVQAATVARRNLRGLAVEFADLTVRLGPGRTTAEVEVTARAQPAGEKEGYFHELRFQLRQVDRAWLITRVETVRTLEK